jgi:hypothetical protein
MNFAVDHGELRANITIGARMNLDEALAVHAYLLNVPHEQRTHQEREAFVEAWTTIIAYAKQAMSKVHSR